MKKIAITTATRMLFPTKKYPDTYGIALYPAYISSVECYGNGQFNINTTKGKTLTYKEIEKGKFILQ